MKSEPVPTPETLELTICPYSGSPHMCACPDEATWNDEDLCFDEPPCRGEATPVVYRRFHDVAKGDQAT